MVSGLRIAAARKQIQIALADVNATSYYDSRIRVDAVADMIAIGGPSASLHALKARYLWQTFRSAPVSEKATWLEEACQEISAALTGTPCLPVEALACAVFYDEANQWGFRRDPGHFLFSLYEWAILCQPNEASVLKQALPAAWRAYLQALFDGSAGDRKQLRARMLALFRHGFRAIPASVEFCRLLKQADCNAEEYERIFPETSEGRLVMARLLMRMNRLETALALCRPLRYACQSQVALQGVLRLLRSEIGLEMEILEKLNRPEERRELWRQLQVLQAARAERAGQRAESLLDDTQMEDALALLQNALRRGAVTPELIFQACHYEIQMGHGEQIPYLLMYFLTFGNSRRNLSDVKEARALLAASGTDGMWERPLVAFLPAAFVVMQAEADASSCSKTELREAVRSLENMVNSKENPQGEGLGNTAWGQLHLASLFAARGWTLLQKKREALRCYRKVLELSPRNLYGIEGVHQIDAGQLSPEEMEYWKLVHSRIEPVCQFDNGITWLAAQGTPEVLTQNSPCQRIRLLFCVEHSVTNLTGARFEFQNRTGQLLFTGSMKFPPKDGRSLQARPLGELFLIEGTEYFLAGPSRMFPAGDIYLKMIWHSPDADRHQYGAPVVKIATLNP